MVGVAVALCGVGQVVAADDDPLLQLKKARDEHAEYVWALRRSEIDVAPRWDPLKAEAPLSPYQAVAAAEKYLQERYGSSVHLHTPGMLSLSKRSVEEYHGDPVPDVWVYDILFASDSVALNVSEVLDVMVLLNGKVIVPSETLLK